MKTRKPKNLPSVYVVNHIRSGIGIMKNLKLKKKERELWTLVWNKSSMVRCRRILDQIQAIQEPILESNQNVKYYSFEPYSRSFMTVLTISSIPYSVHSILNIIVIILLSCSKC